MAALTFTAEDARQSETDIDPETARIMALKSPVGETVTVHFPESKGECPCPACDMEGMIITVIPPGGAVAGHGTNDTGKFMYEVQLEESVATCTEKMISID